MASVDTRAPQLRGRIRAAAHPLRGPVADLDPLLQMARDKQVVLLGEATHGTREFYATRAAITRRLLAEQGLVAIAVEADWPDAYRANRFVRGRGTDASPTEALGDFGRFPRWMWRNEEIVELLSWMRTWNDARPPAERVGFYGLDLYSLHASIEAVLGYLDGVDAEAAARARVRYGCFDHVRMGDPQRYGQATSLGLRPSCERDAIDQLVDLRRRARDYLRRDGMVAEDEQFEAEINARVVRDAERYYRGMFGTRVNTWNLRDRHMAEVLEALLDHLGRGGRVAKVAVWAHNSHLGDARATEMGASGELNLGQLAREAWPSRALNVGFTTSSGTVTAASDWGAPVERKRVRLPLHGSIERMLHEAQIGDAFIDLRDPALREALDEPVLERAIGVIYRPETERHSHYFDARVARQFDALIHLEHTEALRPLDLTPTWERGEPADVPETFPTGY